METLEQGEKIPLSTAIEQTATLRAESTFAFLNRKGIARVDFIENIGKEPFGITIVDGDDKSWASGIFQLQQKLGMPLSDDPEGCDGKLGPYTYRNYQRFLLQQGSQGARGDFRRSLETEQAGQDTGRDRQKAATGVSESAESEKSEIGKTVFIGDSLTAGMKAARGIDGAQECFKGGMQTGWMRGTFLAAYFENGSKPAKLKPEFAGLKKIVVLGGVNDISSLKSVEEIKRNLSAIYTAAKEAGLQVVACTIPDWDTKKAVESFEKTFSRRGWQGGHYPDSPEKLTQKNT